MEIFAFVSTAILLLVFQLQDGYIMCICYIHRIMDNIAPNHKVLSRTELDTKKRLTPFRKKSCPCVKKNLLSLMHFCKQKKANKSAV